MASSIGSTAQPVPGSEPRSSVARNALHLVMGQAATMVLGIVFSGAVGRALKTDFAVYFLISSFSAFALVVVDWGQQFFGIRAVARNPERGGDLLGTGLVLRAVGTILVCIPTGLSAWALGYDPRTCFFAVAFVAVSMPLFLAQNFGVVFRGHDRMGLDATVSVTNRAVLLVLGLAALGLGFGLGGVVVAQGLAGLAALAVAFWLYRHIAHGPLRFSRATAWEILGGGTAIVTMTLAANVQPYIDAVLLSKLVPKDAVGWYGAAKALMGTLLAPSLILGSAAFPRLSRAAGDVPRFRREFTHAQRPMVWLGGLAAVGTWTFAPVAIRIVYGPEHFLPAGPILRVFGLALFLVFIDVLLGNALTALGRSTAFSVIKIATVGLATGLELFLIPYSQQRWGNGGLGVVSSFVLAEAVLFSGSLLLMPRGTMGASILVDAFRALVASVVTGVFLHSLPSIGPWLAIPLCIAVYILCSLALGLLRPSDLKSLREQLRNEPLRSPATPASDSAGASIQ